MKKKDTYLKPKFKKIDGDKREKQLQQPISDASNHCGRCRNGQGQGGEPDKRNGVDNLSAELKQKFDSYRSDPGANVSEFFSFEEFATVFSATTFQWMFFYKNTLFGITNFGETSVRNMTCEFFIESSGDKTQLFETPEKMFDTVRIENKTLEDIWSEVYDS